MPQFKRAEIWSSYQSNSGTRLAVVQKLLRCHGREALDGTDSVEIDFPSTDAAGVATTRQILRLVFSDGSFSEWRIRSRHEQNSESGTIVTLTAYTPLQDMADPGYITELSSAGMPNFEIGLSKVTVTEVINTYVLPKLAATGYSYFALGTIEPDELEDFIIRKMTPLGVLRALCDTFRDSETKRPAELRVRRNGTTGYYIDVLRSIGSTASTADLRYKKNLRRTDLTTDSERQATVVQPLGADLPDGTPSGIARVAFRLGTPTGLVYPITDPEGGPSPILFEDQLTGYYVVADSTNPLVEITASSPGDPATVTLAASTGITAGGVYELRKNADGEFLSDMPSATTITDYKVQAVERGDLLGARNLVGNGWFRLWPDASSPPTDHEYFGDDTLLSKNTDPLYTQLGGASLKMVYSGTIGRLAGIRTPRFYPHAQVGLQLYCPKVRVFFKEFSGAAWFYVRLVDYVDGSVIKSLTLTAENNPIEKGYVPTVGSWVDISIINVDLIDFNENGCRLEVYGGAGSSGTAGSIEYYLDAAQVTQTVGEPPDRYIEYSGSNQLWREGNRVLATFTEPPEHYEIDVVDLSRLDGSTYPFDTLTLGANIRLTDASLSIRGELLRLVEFSLIDYQRPADTRIKVASRWEQFVDVVFAVGSRPAVTPGLTPGTTQPPGQPPGTPPTTPPPERPVAETDADIDVAVYVANDLAALLEQPPEATRYFPRAREWVDASDKTHGRLLVDVEEVGATSARLIERFTADPDADPNDASVWINAGANGVEIPVTIATIGPQKTDDWVPLHASARADVRWQTFAIGGDGAATPVIGNVHFQLRRSIEAQMEKWYWRNLTPTGQPDYFAGAPALGGSTVEEQTEDTRSDPTSTIIASSIFAGGWAFECDPALGIDALTSPTREEVETGARVLSRRKSPSDAVKAFLVGLGNDVHLDMFGPLGRFIGPPLAAQAVRSFAWEAWYDAVEGSAFTDGSSGLHLWVWRPGVGKVLLTERVVDGFSVGIFAESFAGGPAQKYVRYARRQVHNWGVVPGFTAEAGDRFILDVTGYTKCGCGGGDHTQGIGVNVGYNGLTEQTDSEGEVAGDGTAAYLTLPRLEYIEPDPAG